MGGVLRGGDHPRWVRLTAASLAALDTPTADSFAEITKAVANQQLTAAGAIRFVVPADPGDVNAVTPYWRKRGAKDLSCSAAPPAICWTPS
jgi:hypothetical protein